MVIYPFSWGISNNSNGQAIILDLQKYRGNYPACRKERKLEESGRASGGAKTRNNDNKSGN